MDKQVNPADPYADLRACEIVIRQKHRELFSLMEFLVFDAQHQGLEVGNWGLSFLLDIRWPKE